MSGTILERLQRKRLAYFDSMVLIYFIEKHAVYGTLVRPLFELIGEGKVAGLTSYVTLLEVLVRPLQVGRKDLAAEYRRALVGSSNVFLIPVGLQVAERAALLRAELRVRTPDAIQLATAIEERADVFVTNDERLKRCASLDVVVLDEFLPATSP